MFSTQLLTLITCYTLPPTQHHSFFRNLPLYYFRLVTRHIANKMLVVKDKKLVLSICFPGRSFSIEFKLRSPKNRASDGPDKIQLRPYVYFKTHALLDLEVLLNKRHNPHQSQIVPAASPIRCLL